MSFGNSQLSSEERRVLIEKVEASFAEQRSRGQAPGSSEETLAELERDAHAGRDVKFDLRCSADEKLRWAEAARALGLSASEFVRDVANQAAEGSRGRAGRRELTRPDQVCARRFPGSTQGSPDRRCPRSSTSRPPTRLDLKPPSVLGGDHNRRGASPFTETQSPS